jgi:hypothetical protein
VVICPFTKLADAKWPARLRKLLVRQGKICADCGAELDPKDDGRCECREKQAGLGDWVTNALGAPTAAQAQAPATTVAQNQAINAIRVQQPSAVPLSRPQGKQFIGTLAPPITEHLPTMPSAILGSRADAGTAPGMPKQADLAPGVQLQPSQADAAERLKNTDGLLLYHGLGQGKTLGSIASVEGLGNATANAVVPAALRTNFRKEVDRFVANPGNRYNVLSYEQAARAGVNPVDVAVMDEVQRMRGQGSTYQGALQAAAKSNKRVLLSGTPLVNTPGDLAAIINLLHARQIYSPEEFEQRFAGKKIKHSWFGLGKSQVVPTIEHEKELRKLLEGRVHYVPSKSDTKPQVTEEEVPVEMSSAQAKLNKVLLNKAPFWARWAVRHNLPVEKQQSPQLNAFMSGMRQVSLSPYGFDRRLTPEAAFDQSPKLQKAMADLTDTVKKGGRVVAYSNYTNASLVPYSAALKRAGIPHVVFDGKMNDADRKAAVEAYNNGKVQAVLIGPAGAEGISLKGTRLHQALDPAWNKAKMDQSEGRGIRLDSHVHLSPEDRNVVIKRYISQPPPSWLGRLLGWDPPVGADRYLYSRAAEKEKTLEIFKRLLEDVGK